MAIKKVGLSWATVSDIKKSREFFTQTLGLKVIEDDEQYGWLELQGKAGGPVFGFCTSAGSEHVKPGSNAVVTFVTDTYDETKKEFIQKGIKLFDEVSGYPGVPRMICFRDLDGNLLQLVEETKGETDK